MVEMGIW